MITEGGIPNSVRSTVCIQYAYKQTKKKKRQKSKNMIWRIQNDDLSGALGWVYQIGRDVAQYIHTYTYTHHIAFRAI